MSWLNISHVNIAKSRWNLQVRSDSVSAEELNWEDVEESPFSEDQGTPSDSVANYTPHPQVSF